MADAEDIKKLPFANYDIVVYFGVGVLSLPLIFGGIVQPLGVVLPSLSIPLKNDFAASAISTLAALFGGYAAGHVLAFLSAYFIEKFVHRSLGYPSDVYIRQCDQFSESVQYKIKWKRMAGSFPSLIMLLFHLPLIPFYALIYFTQSFGFYSPKVNLAFRNVAQDKIKALGLNVDVDSNSRWIKILEYYVANNAPSGYARMYNYLVIYGCMRSISMLCIGYVWYYLFNGFCKLQWSKDGTVASAVLGLPQHPIFYAIGYIFIAMFALFSVLSFAKFNRRYFEEALQSFCLAGEPKSPQARAII